MQSYHNSGSPLYSGVMAYLRSADLQCGKVDFLFDPFCCTQHFLFLGIKKWNKYIRTLI